VEGAYLNFLTN